MIFIILCYMASLAASLIFLQYHINLFKYPTYFSFSLVLAIFIPLSVTFLLPIDYVTHFHSEIPLLSLSGSLTLFLWKADYWSTFLLTWFLLPILQEFYRATSYLKLERLKMSLMRNLKFQAVMVSISLLGALYLIMEAGLTFHNLKSMIIGLSHIYSLVLALWLMAHGLIAIPRNRWLEGNLIQNIRHQYLKVPKLVDTIEDTEISFKEEVLQVIILRENFTNPNDSLSFAYRDWILRLYNQIPEHIKDVVRRQYTYSESNVSITREQITDSFMHKLTSSFQTNLYTLLAYNSEYDKLLELISQLQKLIQAKASNNVEERLQIMASFNGILPPNISYYFHCIAKPIIARLLSLILFTMTFVVIESEYFHSTDLSMINGLVHKTSITQHPLLQVSFASLIFMYMLFCSLNSLAKLKVFNMYHLVPRNSDPVSACFYASYIARMTIPLSYNFITLFVSRSSTFEEWYGQSIQLTGFFNLMNNWVPRLVLLPVLLTTFNFYDRLKNKLGINSSFYDWADFDDDTLRSENNVGGLERSAFTQNELVIAEAKRMVSMELDRRSNLHQVSLRSFNLQNGAMPANDLFDLYLQDNLDNRLDQDLITETS